MRLAQNKEVAAIAARLDNRRSHWMRGHVHYLDGWIPARAGEELRAQPLEHLPPVERFEEQPGSVNGTMKEYQARRPSRGGVSVLFWAFGCEGLGWIAPGCCACTYRCCDPPVSRRCGRC